MTLEQMADDEKQRINSILATFKVDENRRKLLEPVIENTAWMKAKLDETRVAIKASKVAIAYDNGGGQKGIRENPLFKGYSALWKSYMTGMSAILAGIPQGTEDINVPDVEAPKTVLQLIRDKHRKDA